MVLLEKMCGIVADTLAKEKKLMPIGKLPAQCGDNPPTVDSVKFAKVANTFGNLDAALQVLFDQINEFFRFLVGMRPGIQAHHCLGGFL